MLAVVFTESEAFGREFHENLSKGGMFVPTDQAVELRSRVEVGIHLQFCQESIVLEGEVVHCVAAELASAGAVPGVAVHFDRPVGELCAAFESLVGVIPEPGPQPSAKREEPPDERRRSPRQPARVVARVRYCGGEELEGMTRNLSVSGILFSVTGEPLPIGERVVVTLLNPKSGESLEIPSEVMRHVKGEAGDVPALGIHFSPDETCRESTKAFLRRLKDTEHTRRLGGISGDIEELGLANLLQSLSLSSDEGTITLMNGNHEGFVAFAQGCLVSARVGRVTGAKALARLLGWEAGSFEFHARIDSYISRSTPVRMEAAVLEAMRQLDESGRDASARFAPGEGFEAATEVLAGLAGDLSKTECAIIDLVRAGANVRRLLDVIPESDASILRALANLVEQRALVPQAPAR